jgi:hypothetical protein
MLLDTLGVTVRLVVVAALALPCLGLLVSPAQATTLTPVPAPGRIGVPRVPPHPVSPNLGTTVVLKGLDSSMRVTNYPAVKAAGYGVMGRYLEIDQTTGAPGPGGKAYFLTKTELASAQAAGVGIFLIFEWYTVSSNLPITFAQGAGDAKIAQNALTVLGLPLTTPVYFSCDVAQGRCTILQIVDYFKGVNSVIGSPAWVGCYGSKAMLTSLKQLNLIKFLWHARWMDGNPALTYENGWGAQMYQSTALVYRGGAYCDQDSAFTTDIGQVR